MLAQCLAYLRLNKPLNKTVETVQSMGIPTMKTPELPKMAPVMTLAPELHLAIAHYLDGYSVMLKLANRYFYNTIKPLTHERAMTASSLFLRGKRGDRFQVCGECCRIRPEEEFELRHYARDTSACIECKVQQGRKGYGQGEKIKLGR